MANPLEKIEDGTTRRVTERTDARIDLERVPVGGMLKWSGSDSSIPAQYIKCDGRPVRSSQYPALFRIIGLRNGYAGNDDTFHVPTDSGFIVRAF